jgi:Bifunctional DNA primase/polymerase, N-terminal
MTAQPAAIRSPAENPNLKAALRYAKRGWKVLPLWPRDGDECGCGDSKCDNPGKHPIGRLAPNGFKSATTDEKEIRRWFRKYPDAGIGIATGEVSGIVVLDIDVKNGKDGSTSLVPLLAQYDLLPETKTAATPSGGTHRYFKYAKGIGCSTDKLGPGLDVKGDRGFIVAPPSHGLYKWIIREHVAELPKPRIKLLRSLNDPGGKPSNNAEADPKLVAKAVAVLPNDKSIDTDWFGYPCGHQR